MYLPALTDQELLNYAQQTVDALTTSELERELLRRLETRMDEEADDQPLTQALDAAGIERGDLHLLVDILREFSCEDRGSLRAKLERADKFYDIATEAGDVVDRLNDLMKEIA